MPRIFAHRGFAIGVAENTLEAFRAAVEAGATHIESDLQVTRDGVAVLFHDGDLSRVSALPQKISDLKLAELQNVALTNGGFVPTLEQALLALPETRFNLDFKVFEVIKPAAEVINRLRAHDRVLVASFSDRNRKQAIRQMSSTVASSAGTWLVAKLWLAHKLGRQNLVTRLARSVQLMQLPVSSFGIRFDDEKFVAAMTQAGLEVHFWTINEPTEMLRLIAIGAHGIVTDRTDLAVNTLRKR